MATQKKVKKLAVGFSESLLEMYGDLRFSQTERRSFLNASWELWLRNPHSQRFHQMLQHFFDELELQRKPVWKIGSYIANRLKK
jgi:hypothetical protein